MMIPIQTPVITEPLIRRDVFTKTNTPGSRTIEQYLTALEKNRPAPLPTSNPVPPFADSNHPLFSTWMRLEALFDLGENWNGNDVAPPNADAIANAKDWVQSLYDVTSCDEQIWIPPHVTANEDGDAVFEWARGRKRLAVYIGPKEAIYIKAWGPSIVHDMVDGDATDADTRLGLWKWLVE